MLKSEKELGQFGPGGSSTLVNGENGRMRGQRPGHGVALSHGAKCWGFIPSFWDATLNTLLKGLQTLAT